MEIDAIKNIRYQLFKEDTRGDAYFAAQLASHCFRETSHVLIIATLSETITRFCMLKINIANASANQTETI